MIRREDGSEKGEEGRREGRREGGVRNNRLGKKEGGREEEPVLLLTAFNNACWRRIYCNYINRKH